MTELCTIDECGRPNSAGGLCSTHRRRRRLKLPMHAPIRSREVTLSDLLAAAWDLQEVEGTDAFEGGVRRFRRMVKRWASCP